MFLNIGAFIVVVGVLIFVHELGHFLAAKATGVQVLRFALGFGRPLVAWRRGETEYCVCVLPLGGYVKMAGLEEEGTMGAVEGGPAEAPVDPARAFDRKPLWARLIIILAGVTMNMIFAFLVYTGLGLTGDLEPDALATTRVDTVLVGDLPPVAAPLAGLPRGTLITTVNDDSVHSWSDLLFRIATAPAPVRIGTEGGQTPVEIPFGPGDTASRAATLRALNPFIDPVIATVQGGSAAERAGMRAGDRLMMVGTDTVRSWRDFTLAARAAPERPLVVQVRRGDSTLALTVTPARREDTDPVSGERRVIGFVGVSALLPRVPPLGVVAAVQAGARETVDRAQLVIGFLGGLVTGRASVRDLGGPIAIGQQSGQAARAGLSYLFWMMAFFSVNLAVLNLLPIPILDGGQVVFLLAEGVRGRPLSLGVRLRLTQVGFFILLAIMALAISNDVLRLFHR